MGGGLQPHCGDIQEVKEQYGRSVCSPAHDVAQFLQVGGGEVVVVAVAALDVLVYSVQIEGNRVQQLDLHMEDTKS